MADQAPPSPLDGWEVCDEPGCPSWDLDATDGEVDDFADANYWAHGAHHVHLGDAFFIQSAEPDLWQYGMPDPGVGPDVVVPFERRPRLITAQMVRRPMRVAGPWRPASEMGN